MSKKIVASAISLILSAVVLHFNPGAKVANKIEGRVVDDEAKR
jgi:hypothetical protein